MTVRFGFLYRLYFAPKSALERLMVRFPWAREPVERCKRWIKRRLMPHGDAWVRVSAGLSAGMRMRLRFPEEAGVWRGEHEPEVQAAIHAVVRPGWVVFDIGASIGTFALGTARLVGSAGRVVAFEADPVSAARLREHAVANKLDGVLEVVHAAVWSGDSEETIPFRCGGIMRTQGGVETGTMRPILGGGELITVPVISLDSYVASTGVAPQLIKIDVEGAEVEVLRGGAKLFASYRPLIIAEIHTERARDQVRAWMLEHEYSNLETVLYDPVPIRLLAWPSEQNPGPWPRAVAVCRGGRSGS